MKFFQFSQNNPGGRFVTNNNLAQVVIIEANDALDANEIAERIGIYFNGVSEGQDCKCCGDRWDSTSESDGSEEPLVYRMKINEYLKKYPEDEIKIHYKNGVVQHVVNKEKKSA